jgi:hypothetical protein
LLIENYRRRNVNIGTTLNARLITSANVRKEVEETGNGDM